jgi:DNA-directed RNA polymerase subunit RPC12/RpoP
MESDLRPYVCVECERRFTSKLFLKRHSAVHSSTRSYQCIICPSTYKYKKGLNRHLKKAHPDYYNTLNLTPFKKKTASKVKENDSDSGQSSETLPNTQDSIIDIAKPQVIQLERPDPLPVPFLSNFTTPQIIPIPEKHKNNFSNHQIASNTLQKPSEDSWKDFNRAIYSNFFQFSSKILNSSKNNEGGFKGFIPVNDEKIGRESNATKRIEYLEGKIRKYKFVEASMNIELEKEKKKTLELEQEVGKFKVFYRMNVWEKDCLRKRVKLEEDEGNKVEE